MGVRIIVIAGIRLFTGYGMMDYKRNEDIKRNGIILAQNYENKK
jgi:hypothetical protein